MTFWTWFGCASNLQRQLNSVRYLLRFSHDVLPIAEPVFGILVGLIVSYSLL